MIKGYCDDRFLKIKNIFSNQIISGYELGCSVAVEYKGKEVINLYGGYTDETKTNLWKKNTLVNVWSVTKAITGVCIARLISENKLDVNNKVSYYWPEYDCNGKSNTKVIDLLTHRAGMFAFEDNYPKCSWNDWEEFTSALEKQKPFREPGLSQGYHAMTFAWLVGEIIRRIDSVDCIIMAAAVADFKPEITNEGKLKKDDIEKLKLNLVKNDDILNLIKDSKCIKIGFAAETNNHDEYGVKKLNSKCLDMIVINDVSNNQIGFESEYNQVKIITKKGDIFKSDIENKKIIASNIVDKLKTIIN